ncbi:efflux RND transporter permease subunit [Endozoicomonas montiporae]|uniref:AcrB/AcrD/AcrF family protein n=1 Tax=Endozoicomonas montiporae CL-33 TaxID=570277 RepID=A0A142BBZ1_9GAMM|nr:efflux RND transporter permease subunit [Endozoicomonas montiporae]AMO56267.1 AcrB/AcrD/AcrF family protein [Endozoicomonas montiporae CL-33]
MSITRTAIVNNRTTLVLLLVLVLSGLQAYQNLPRAYDPGFVIRVAKVITQFPGASPERVETLITDRIEKAVREIPELDFVKSASRTGTSIVTVNIQERYTDMRPIWDSLRRKMEDIASEMPDGAIGPLVNDEFGEVFGVMVTLTGEDFSYRALKTIADEVRDEFLNLPEVAKVDIYGAQEERIFIRYNNDRLGQLGLSPGWLMQQLGSRNIVVPGGAINLHHERIELEPTGNFDSVHDIRQTVIPIPGSDRVLHLEDVATVERGYVDPARSFVKASGVPALALGIAMGEGGNNIELGRQVEATMLALQQTYPIGINFELMHFSPKEVEDKVNDFVSNLIQAILVVSAVMLFSLGPRTGLIVATLIPTSMIAAMLVMSLVGIGLDQISLAALIIALGMLVDNGIVMAENTMVQMQSGKPPLEAAVDSAGELRVPLLTSSLTTAAAFLPIYLAESAVGEFTASLFLVVTITLLCSWVLSLTLIPLLCVLFLKVKQQQTDYTQGLYAAYRRLLEGLLAHRLATLGVVALLFTLVMNAFQYVPKIFFPASDRLYFKTELQLPPGTTIGRTLAVVNQLDRFIAEELQVSDLRQEGVTRWVSHIGSGGARFVLQHSPEPARSNYALMVLNTSSDQVIDALIQKLDRYGFEQFPDLQINSRRIESGVSIKNPVEVRLYGRETDQLFRLVQQVKQQMSQISGLKTVRDDWGPRIKKLQVVINQNRALRAGVTSQDIAMSLQTGLSGLELTQFREGSDVVPVILRTAEGDRQDIGKLESLSVFVQSTGQTVPLKQVADIEIVWQPGEILRRDGLKVVSVGAQLDGSITAAEAFGQLTPWLQQQGWPPGYRFEPGGEAESSGKANAAIGAKMPLAAFVILILLVAQFNSIRKPFIILMTIPLGMIGVIIGLLVARSFFGFMTLLGVVSLAGIVINNAIVLLERIRFEQEQNSLPMNEAIVVAAQRRLRPILLTTATTVLGMIPLYLGGGLMWEPMAVAIIAGLLFSTLLTLGVVPVLYSLLFSWPLEKWFPKVAASKQ